MNTYTTDKEIGDMLTTVSDKLNPNEGAFLKMLSSLDTKSVPSVSPYSVKKTSIFNYSFFSTNTMRIASGFAVFVFILGGMFSFRTKPSETTSAPELAATLETPLNILASNNTNIAAEVTKPSINTSKANTESKSTLAVASLKTSAAAPEAVDLQNALTNELNAEITAQIDLLALSENI